MNVEKNQKLQKYRHNIGHDVISGSGKNIRKLNISWLKDTVPLSPGKEAISYT